MKRTLAFLLLTAPYVAKPPGRCLQYEMKSFLIKYRWTILYWVVFLTIVLFLVPRQNDYYLDNDIKAFKQTYLTRILLWTGIGTSIAVFIVVLFKAKSVRQSATAFFSVGVTLAFFLFVFQNVILGFSLFLNRQVKRDTVQKAYVVKYLTGTDQTKDNFFPFDIAAKQPTIDKKLIEKIYRRDLKLSDTVKVTFNKGLFGVAYQSQPFAVK